jgi:hypothetical protein
MKKVLEHFLKDKKFLTGTIIFIAILGTYLGFSITQNVQWNNAVEQWKQYNIQHSPTVCVTTSGERYHNCYHYRKRNFSMSLFEANEKGYTPCGTCHPPIAPTYSGKPDKPAFYLYHCTIASILFSAAYWTVFNQINKRK